jgi:hypothetical protein
VRTIAPAVFFLTRGPAGILGRELADIFWGTGRGEVGETSGEGTVSVSGPAWVGGEGSGVVFIEPNVPWIPWGRLQPVSEWVVCASLSRRQA